MHVPTFTIYGIEAFILFCVAALSATTANAHGKIISTQKSNYMALFTLYQFFEARLNVSILAQILSSKGNKPSIKINGFILLS